MPEVFFQMLLSAPVHSLKRKARLMSRAERIPLHAALDRVAASEGYASWSLLADRFARRGPAARLHAMLSPGDMLLVAARPGQGKTLLGLDLTVEAMRAGKQAFFFSLEYVEADMAKRFRTIGVDPAAVGDRFRFDNSDLINAAYVEAALATAAPGTLVVIDYMQLLDQRRDNPPAGEQMQALAALARRRGFIFVVLSQVDRRYDRAAKPLPDLGDIRLPNPVDLGVFTIACFLQDGEMKVERMS